MKLSEILRGWRLHHEYNLSEISKQIGVSKATLSRVERGETPDAETLRRIILWLFEKPAPAEK